MDVGREPNESKREDLRLTLRDRPDWEAIVEVKGYTGGTKTNDARQIREHRDRYITEKGQPPELTVWLTNPFRQMDPSSRPTPGGHVVEAAENIGAVHVLTTDLYKQWARVKAGDLEADNMIQDLINAGPGLWTPAASNMGT